MTTVGVDRLFSQWITGGSIPYQMLPTLTFVVAFLMGVATGTSWGTMAILYPLILVPTYEAAGGDPQVFYATVSAVMGGAVAGDHSSPISDTTVLTALACEVELMVRYSRQSLVLEEGFFERAFDHFLKSSWSSLVFLFALSLLPVVFVLRNFFFWLSFPTIGSMPNESVTPLLIYLR